MATKFYFCEKCGNVIFKTVDSGVTPSCCGNEMTELEPAMTEGYSERHLPVIRRVNDYTMEVCVGTVKHPMTERHHICFICLETEHGTHFQKLKAGTMPVALFAHGEDKPVAAYAYCNIHGLWKKTLAKGEQAQMFAYFNPYF